MKERKIWLSSWIKTNKSEDQETNYPSLVYNFGMTAKETGEKIKKAREKLKLTQAQAAKKAGLDVNHFAKLERGEHVPGGETIEKLNKALNIKLP